MEASFFIGLYFSISALRVGVSVKAATVDVIMVTVTLKPSCLKSTPVSPSTKVKREEYCHNRKCGNNYCQPDFICGIN